MSVWRRWKERWDTYSWSECRRWDRENENVPWDRFRSSMFYQTPGKQRWAEWRLWRHEKIWGHPLRLTTVGLGAVGLIGKFCGLF
jgi:hypothetical protein